MARIVCQVLHRVDSITFLWSEGTAAFEPYRLDGVERARLLQIAEQLHAQLAGASASELAQLGHALWRALFRLDSADASSASAVQTWLAKLVRENAVEQLQFLSDRPGLIPWNLLCDDVPSTGDLWSRFWGVRFNLGAGRRVKALWANPTLTLSTRLCAADLRLMGQLDPAQHEQAISMREGNQLIHTITSLEDELKNRGPDVLLLLLPWAEGQLWLGSDALDLGELRGWLDEAKEGNPEPIVILMAAGAAEGQASWLRMLEEASARFGGLIANESLLPAPQAFKVGSALAQRLAEGKNNLGEILRALRQEHGAAGLAFSGFCPVQMHVGNESASAEMAIETNPLPGKPFFPFAAYDAADRSLFLGRDIDVARAAATLDAADARGIFLHGSPAVGKTSFLQAALLPHLEQENVGYLALRDRSLQETPAEEKDYPRLILRATHDLAGQFADALAVFCARPFIYTTPAGAAVTVDLPNLLHQAVTGMPRPSKPSTAIQDASAAAAINAEPAPPAEGLAARDLWIALRDDKATLARVLDAVTRSLPFELLIVIDQGEELITLVRRDQQRVRRQKALAMLQHLAQAAPRCKIVLALRSQSLGQLVSLMHNGQAPADWPTFFLRPLNAEEMASALLWPTNRDGIPYTDEVPFTTYGFAFEDGMAERVVADAIAAADSARLSPLPILQAVGTLLYERQVVEMKQNVVRYEDTKQFGGVREALAKCLDLKLKRLDVGNASKGALRELIGKLTTSHADGTLSRDLVPAANLKNLWKNSSEPVEAIVNRAADDEGLFEIQQLLIGGQEEIYVSLPQDSLAQVGKRVEAEQDLQKITRGKVIDVLWIMVPLMFLAAAVTFWATRNFTAGVREDVEITPELEKKILRQIEIEKRRFHAQAARRPLYYGQLARVQQALHAENALRAQQILMEAPAMQSHADVDQRVFPYPDVRTFEWYHFKKVLNSERFLLFGHQSHVTSVAIARDNERAATGSIDGTVRVWNLKNGEIVALLTGAKTPVHAVAFAPDGKTLASAGADKLVYLWDLSTLKTDYVEIKKEAKTLKGHTDAINALAYGKDANTLASGGADKTVILWDIGKGEAAHTLKEAGVVHAVAFTPDWRLVSAGADGAIVWNAETGNKIHVAAQFRVIRAISISPDGKTLCTASNLPSSSGGTSELGRAEFWELLSGKQIPSLLELQSTGMLAVAFGPDGKTVACAGKDHIVRLFDVATGKQLHRWIGHLGYVNALAFAGDGSVLVSGSHDGTGKAWNPAQSSGPDIIAKAHLDAIQCLALDSKGSLLASAARDGSVKLWDSATGKLLKELSLLKEPITAVALSSHKDKTMLAVGTRNDKNEGEIKIYQIDPKKEHAIELRAAFTKHKKGVTCLAFNPSADRPDLLVSVSADTSVKLWDIDKAVEVETYFKHKDEVRSVAFQGDGKAFASGGKDALMCIYDTNVRGAVWVATDLHLNAIEALAFMPSPQVKGEQFDRLLTGGADQAVCVWDINKGDQGKIESQERRRHFRAHVQPVTAVGFNQKDSGLFVSAGADGAIQFYDGLSESLTLTGHVGPVRALLIAPDQSFLVSAGNDGTIRFWRAAERGEDKGERK